MRLADVMKGIGDVRILGDGSVEVTGIKYDSRRVAGGDMFAAIRGENFNGVDFIEEAAGRGARSFLVPEGAELQAPGTLVFASDTRTALAFASRNFFGDPSARMKVVGITGTNGKTTTSYLVHGVLEEAGVEAGLIGTVQYLVGGEVISAARTTPESPELLGLMDAMVRKGCSACIMEVSSHALALKRVEGVRLEAAVFTNLTRDHLDFHTDMEDYFRAKAALFTTSDVKHRVVNEDDPFGRKLLDLITGEVLTFGMRGGDITPEGEVVMAGSGSRCTMKTPWGDVKVKTVLPGRFNLYNVMAAIGVCGLMGLEPAEISKGLASVERVPGRFERVDLGQVFTAVVDYAHTPDALENVLENARSITGGRLITVFGCGGDRDRAKRPLMGEVAGRLSDVVIVTSDNPRSEDPETIIDQIMTGLDGYGEKTRRLTDRKKAIEEAVREAGEGDMVLVAGKGHENYQVIGDRVLPFSDVDEVARAIGTLPGEVP